MPRRQPCPCYLPFVCLTQGGPTGPMVNHCHHQNVWSKCLRRQRSHGATIGRLRAQAILQWSVECRHRRLVILLPAPNCDYGAEIPLSGASLYRESIPQRWAANGVWKLTLPAATDVRAVRAAFCAMSTTNSTQQYCTVTAKIQR